MSLHERVHDVGGENFKRVVSNPLGDVKLMLNRPLNKVWGGDRE